MAVPARHNQPEYKRWLKQLKCLYILKDVLCPYVEKVLTDFHSEQLLGKLGRFCCVDPTMQLEFDMAKNEWSITGEPACTGHNRCADWLNAIAAEHPNENGRDLFGSCDLSQLNASPWEIGKTFLTPAQASGTNGPADLDPYHLLSMLARCRLFNQPPNDIHDAVKKVLRTRYDLAHAAVQGIKTDAEVTDKIDEMIALVKSLPTDPPPVAAELVNVRHGTMEEIDKELSQREVDFFKTFLQEAEQGSFEQLDRIQIEVLLFVKKNEDIWQRIQVDDNNLIVWGQRTIDWLGEEFGETNTTVTGEGQAVGQDVEEESGSTLGSMVDAYRTINSIFQFEQIPAGKAEVDSSDSLEQSGTSSIQIEKMTKIHDGPKLDECAHFHYDCVELGDVEVSMDHENQENESKSPDYYVQVMSQGNTWTIRRSYENFCSFDKQLHSCIYDRNYSMLQELNKNDIKQEGITPLKKMLQLYLRRFTFIAGNMINCGPILSWLQMDNYGNRLIVSEVSAINTRAVGAAQVVKRYTAQAPDEISFEVGEIISLIDMPPANESIWWQGKKDFEVGFFPSDCVELISEKQPLSPFVTEKIPLTPKPVLRGLGKLIPFLRVFFTSRPALTQLKRSGIVEERVFGCDLGEHLLNSERELPKVLLYCAELVERHGVVEGIYRLSGAATNVHKLRNEFDEDGEPDLMDEVYLQDIHSISSLLKAYFRDLPNPLYTFQLYDKFIAAMSDELTKLVEVHNCVQQLPPPHYRTAKYLMRHLALVAKHEDKTGMTCRNLAIVWAPNLLRCKDLDQSCSAAALQGVGMQVTVTEFLITHADFIFSDQLHTLTNRAATRAQLKRKVRTKSVDTALTQSSHQQKYIEVGGGPASLPKYHTVIDLPSKKKSLKDRKTLVPVRCPFSSGTGHGKTTDTMSSDSVGSAGVDGTTHLTMEMENAECQMAMHEVSRTDDEIFQAQNLHFKTDSLNEIQEGFSHLNTTQDGMEQVVNSCGASFTHAGQTGSDNSIDQQRHHHHPRKSLSTVDQERHHMRSDEGISTMDSNHPF